MTVYVAGDGGVTGISAHSSPTRSSSFAWTHASRYTVIQGRHARTRQIWTTTVVGVWFWPVVFFWEAANIWSILTEIWKENTKWMNLVLERVGRLDLKRTAVVLASRGVTLLVCDFDQLVLVMPQTFAPSTETRNEKTKWMNLLLEQVESPGSQRTAVILGPRGVTLPDTLLDMYLTTSP